jgi:hypothetical protein
LRQFLRNVNIFACFMRFVAHPSNTDSYRSIVCGRSSSRSSSPHIRFTHSWSSALLEKLPIVQPLENFPAFYGTRRFTTAFTRALHWSLSWARSIQSPPSHPIPSYLSKIHFNIVHPSTSWSSQWSLSFLISHQYPICVPLLRHSAYPSHPPLLDHSNYTWRRVQVMKLLIM